MAFRCSSCGGNILFDIDSQSMKCQHCGSEFPPEQYQVKNKSTQTDIPEAGLSLFTCGGCGAELQGTEDSAVGFCPYCGGQSLLQTGSDSENETEFVLPFQISRKQCAELYRDYAKKVRYLPKDFTKSEHLDSFTGIYMPYYEYDVQMGQSHIEGTKTVESNSRYEVINTYRIDATVQGDYCGVPFDASRYLDDEIAARTMPFDKNKERPFNPAYLSGFYADVSTVPAETYNRDAETQASQDIVAEVGERVYAQDGIRVDPAVSYVEARTKGHHSSLLPMWFLTWRKGDRVAYAVVNGESGKVVSDLPVDMKAFGIGCAVIAAVLFAVLELFFQPTPILTSVLSLVAGILMAASVRSSTKRIFEKETHANDKGWASGQNAPEETAQEDGQTAGKKKKKDKGGHLGLVLAIIIAVFVAYGMLDEGISLSAGAAVLALLYLLLSVRKVAGWQKSVPEKQPIRAILLVLLGVILNAAIVFISPVNDAWYYMGDAICILILILASVTMTKVYNIGTTRPLPKLFDREEVGS